MILSAIFPLSEEEQKEVIRLEARVNAAISAYHSLGTELVVFVPSDMTDAVRKSIHHAARAEGWRVKFEKGIDATTGCWETWTLSPQKSRVMAA